MPRPPAAESPTSGMLPGAADPSPKQRLPTPVNSGMRWAARWIQVGRRIIFVSAAQVSTTAITAGLGFVYWWLAARFFAPEVVGFGAAATSTMLLLGTLSMSGLGTLLIKELPRYPRQSGPLILASALLAGAVAGALGLSLAVVAPRFSDALRPIATNWGTALLFAAGVSLTAITILMDQAVLGLLRERLQVVRNAVFAATKLAALGRVGIWALSGGQLSGLAFYSIYATWLVGNFVSLVIVFLVMHGRRSATRWHRPDWSLLWALGSSAVAHHLLNLAFLASSLLLPVVVAWRLSTAANAYFYTAWMVAEFVATVPFTLTVSLFAVSATDPRAFTQKIRFTLSLAFLVAGLANVVLWIGADHILSLFGSSYATNGAWSLRIFGLAIFPLIIKDHYLVIRRIRGSVGRAVPFMVVCGALEVGGAAIGAVLGGLQGLSVAWLIAVSIQVIFMAPTVYRVAAGSSALNPQSSGRFGRESAEQMEA